MRAYAIQEIIGILIGLTSAGIFVILALTKNLSYWPTVFCSAGIATGMSMATHAVCILIKNGHGMTSFKKLLNMR